MAPLRQVFANTSYWFALLNSADSSYLRAVRISKGLAGVQILTSDYVLIELANTVSRWAVPTRNAALNALTSMTVQDPENVVPHGYDIFHAAAELLRKRPDKSWSFVDCTSFVIMKQLGITEALSTDHHFEQAGFVCLLK